MSYREKQPVAALAEPPAERRKQQQFVLWLLPIIILAPNLGRFAKLLGLKATYAIVLGGTVAMTAICIMGAIVSYRSARATVARDMAELTQRHS